MRVQDKKQPRLATLLLKDGLPTRKHREKITQYEMTFPESGSLKLTALDRVKMLKKLDL